MNLFPAVTLVRQFVSIFRPLNICESGVQKANLLIYSVLTTAIFAVGYVLVSVAISFDPGVIIMLGDFVTLFLVLTLFRFTGNMGLCAHLYIASCVAAILGCSYYSGGFSSPVMPWFILVPVVCVLLFELSWGVLIWTTVVFGMIVSMAVGAAYEYEYPFAYEHEHVVMFYVSTILGLGMILTLLATIFAINRRSALLKLEQQNAALVVAQERAESAARAKADFLANVSHEIRTPVSTMVGMGYLVLKTELNSRQREMLEIMQECGKHLNSLINQVLDYSKVEAGMLVLEKMPMSLQGVLNKVVALTVESAQAKGLDLQVDVQPGLPDELIGDPLRLSEILLNYVSNAVKFTSAGGVTVAVSSRAVFANRIELLFQVTDTGIGLAQEQIGRLFTSFQQADSSTTRQFGGTGLGLAISKRLARLMDGSVGVRSEAGRGSTFWFTAVLELAQAPVRALSQQADVNGGETSTTVLVVDDLPMNLTMMRELLSPVYTVVLAQSGAQALELVRGHKIDVVLLDVMMPEMDGYAVCSALKADAQTRDIPVVFLSAKDQPEAKSRGYQLGAADYLGKPIDPDKVFQSIAKVLSRSAAPSVSSPQGISGSI
jgi:signal transduction histidine kinase/ActR/RegA family two-component response regulator